MAVYLQRLLLFPILTILLSSICTDSAFATPFFENKCRSILGQMGEGEEFYVSMGESISFEAPDTALACLGPCIGIGIINVKTKKGYLGHHLPFLHRAIATSEFDQLFEMATSESESTSDLRILIVGNNRSSSDAKTVADEVATEIREYFAKRGIKAPKIKFHLSEKTLDGVHTLIVKPGAKKLSVTWQARSFE